MQVLWVGLPTRFAPPELRARQGGAKRVVTRERLSDERRYGSPERRSARPVRSPLHAPVRPGTDVYPPRRLGLGWPYVPSGGALVASEAPHFGGEAILPRTVEGARCDEYRRGRVASVRNSRIRSQHRRRCLEARGCGSGLPVINRRLVDPDPRRHLPLEEPEIQAAFSDVIADGAEFRRISSPQGLRASKHEITKWQRRGVCVGSWGTPAVPAAVHRIRSASIATDSADRCSIGSTCTWRCRW